MKKRKRHTPEQIINKLRLAERLRAEGQTVADVARQLVEVSQPDLVPIECGMSTKTGQLYIQTHRASLPR